MNQSGSNSKASGDAWLDEQLSKPAIVLERGFVLSVEENITRANWFRYKIFGLVALVSAVFLLLFFPIDQLILLGQTLGDWDMVSLNFRARAESLDLSALLFFPPTVLIAGALFLAVAALVSEALRE